MTLGDRLKKARERRGWSQLYVSKTTKISNTVLSNYERNYRDPDSETLARLAGLYGVSVDYLLGLTNEPEAKITKDQAKNAVIEKYSRLPPDKKKVIDDLIDLLEKQE